MLFGVKLKLEALIKLSRQLNNVYCSCQTTFFVTADFVKMCVNHAILTYNSTSREHVVMAGPMLSLLGIIHC